MLSPTTSIVVITSIVVAATAASISHKFDGFSHIGGIIGSAVSASFLLVLGLANAYILLLLLRQMHKLLGWYACNPDNNDHHQPLKFEGGGCLFRVFKKLFKLVNRYALSQDSNKLNSFGYDAGSITLRGILNGH